MIDPVSLPAPSIDYVKGYTDAARGKQAELDAEYNRGYIESDQRWSRALGISTSAWGMPTHSRLHELRERVSHERCGDRGCRGCSACVHALAYADRGEFMGLAAVAGRAVAA